MGIWVQACCTTAVARALHSIDAFFDSLDLTELEIELGGVDGFDATTFRDSLKIERAPKLPPPLDICWFSVLHRYQDTDDGCSWDRLTNDEQIQGSVEFLLGNIPRDMSPDSVSRITTVLTQTVEVVQTRLGDSAGGSLGGLLAQETGKWLANLGAGLLVVEHEWWFDPQAGEPLT